MKLNLLKSMCFAVVALTTAQSPAATQYIVTLTNGGAMPLSPAAIYVKNGQQGNAKIGQKPSVGFVQLCQTGNPSLRIQELGMDTDVKFVTQTMGLLMPGESRAVTIDVADPLQQSIQIETMYGKTKDTCAVGSVNSHSLYALKQHVSSEFLSKDNVVQTGAFLNAALPMGHSYLDTNICNSSKDAVSCLRELALPNKGNNQIHFFSSYLPSLISLLEMKYGAQDVQTLIIPSSGALQIQTVLKH